MEKQGGIFQSLTSFSSGDEMLTVGLSLFSSLSYEELVCKTGQLLQPGVINTGNGYASEIRRRSFLQGRIAGKMAVNIIFPDVHTAGLQIETGILGAPVLKNLSCPVGISIAHDDIWNAGVCFPLSIQMGIDVETIREKNRTVIPSVLTGKEKELCSAEDDPLKFLHLLWTAKEAVGKAIGLGFRAPVGWYEIDLVETIRPYLQLIYRCRFKELTVFTALSVKIPGGMLSIAFPAENNLEQPMTRLLEQLVMDSE
jgi:4'-phosphopantetheinyl transferase EntD